MSAFVKKITSRKFLMAVIGMVSGLALAFGIEGSEIERIVAIVGGLLTSVGSIISYINGEAAVDAAAVGRGDGNAEQS